MSQQPGSATSADNSKRPAGSGSSPPSTPASSLNSDAASSLSALASGTRSRQSLTGLAGSIRKDSSLASLASRNEGNGTGGISLQGLAKGGNSSLGTGLTRTPGSLTRLAAASSSSGNNGADAPTLSSLAGSRGSLQSSTPVPTVSDSTPPSDSSMPAAGLSAPSLSQLAAASQNTAPRRSLASLAKPSQALQSPTSATSPLSPSSTGLSRPSTGLTARSGGLLGLSRLGGAPQRPAEANSTTDSPSLSSLASKSSTPTLADLAKQTPDSATTPAVEVTSASGPSSPEPKVTSDSVPSVRDGSGAQALDLSTLSLVDESETTSPELESHPRPEYSSAPFSSLIGTPSHFALSIFERLDPSPSPIALSTTTILQSDPKLLRNILRSSVSGAVTPSRIFSFDIPSPDDKVLQAQGQRPVAVARS